MFPIYSTYFDICDLLTHGFTVFSLVISSDIDMNCNSNDPITVTRELMAMAIETLNDEEDSLSWIQQYHSSINIQQSQQHCSRSFSCTQSHNKMEPLPYPVVPPSKQQQQQNQYQHQQQDQRTHSRSSHHSHSSHSHHSETQLQQQQPQHQQQQQRRFNSHSLELNSYSRQHQNIGTTPHPHNNPIEHHHSHALVMEGEIKRRDVSLVGGRALRGSSTEHDSNDKRGSSNASNSSTERMHQHHQHHQHQQYSQHPMMLSPPRLHRGMTAYEPYQQYNNNPGTPQHSLHTQQQQQQQLMPPSQRTPSLHHSPAAAHFHQPFTYRGVGGVMEENDRIELGGVPGVRENNMGMRNNESDFGEGGGGGRNNRGGGGARSREGSTTKKMRLNKSSSSSQTSTALTPLFDTIGTNNNDPIELDLQPQHQQPHQSHHSYIDHHHLRTSSKGRGDMSEGTSTRSNISMTSTSPRIRQENTPKKNSNSQLSPLSPKHNQKNDSSKNDEKFNEPSSGGNKKGENVTIQSLKKEIADLQDYVDELKYSESVEIGALQHQLRKTNLNESQMRKKNENDLRKVSKDYEDALITEVARLEKIEKMIQSMLSPISTGLHRQSPCKTHQSAVHDHISKEFNSRSNSSDSPSVNPSRNSEYESIKSDNAYHGDNDDDGAEEDDETSVMITDQNLLGSDLKKSASNKNTSSIGKETHRNHARLRALVTNKAKKIQQHLIQLQAFVQELQSSESIEIGELKSTIKRLRGEESHRSAKLEKEIHYLRRQLATQNKNATTSNIADFNRMNVDEQRDQESVRSIDQYHQHNNNSDNALIVRDGSRELGEIGMPPLPNIRNHHDDQEKVDLRKEVQQLKLQIEELASSESVEIGGLRNTIAILRKNENRTVRELERQIDILKNQLFQDRNTTIPGEIQNDEDLRAENKRLRIALIEKCSFDTNELELVNSSSTGSRNTLDSVTSESDMQGKKYLSSQEEDNAILSLKQRLCDKEDIIKSLQTELERVRSTKESSNQKKPIPTQMSNIDCQKATESAGANTDKPKSKSNAPIHESRSKSKGSHALTESDVLVTTKDVRPPLGALKIRDSNEMTGDLNQKLRKKVSDLSKEVNKWRIKATLLVEKKNKTKQLARENSGLKEKIKKLQDKLKTFDGYESPLPSPVPKACPKSRCTV